MQQLFFKTFSLRARKGLNCYDDVTQAKPHAILEITFGVDLLLTMLNQPRGIAIWNAWVSSMVPLLNPDMAEHTDPPILFSIDCSNGILKGLNLDGIDLDSVWLEKADLSRASLRNSRIGFCAHAIFSDADLSNAVFDGDISGTDFTNARLPGVVFKEYCTYSTSSPPIGLSPDLLAQCKEVDDDDVDEPSVAAVSPVGRTIEVKGNLMVMKGRRGR